MIHWGGDKDDLLALVLGQQLVQRIAAHHPMTIFGAAGQSALGDL